MRKLFAAVFAFIVCGLSSVFAQTGSPVGTEPINRVGNSSFEGEFFFSGATPPFWNFEAFQPTAVHIWDDTQAKAGTKSVKIIAPTLNDARWIQTVNVEPNAWYFLSGWIKTEDVAHSPESVDAGANVSVLGTFTHTQGLIGTHDWTPVGVLFNSESNRQVTVAARLGFYSGTTTGTAWFDDVRVTPIVPLEPHPRWKILVLIYRNTDFTYIDASGTQRHVAASMAQSEIENAADQARQFVEKDIPALSSGNMIPTVTIRYPDRVLNQLSPNGDGFWPSPEDTAEELDPAFDSVIVIWDPRTTDQRTGESIWIGSAAGLTPARGSGQAYATMIIEATAYGHRNVFKHEWGHSILEFFDAMGFAPKPKVENHATPFQYVNCVTGFSYVWVDETEADPIPNSIYNNESGFTHDYYSGTTALATDPTKCLGVTPQAWAYGGPISNSGSYYAFPRTEIVNDRLTLVITSTELAPPVGGGPAGVFIVNVVLTNRSFETIFGPVNAVVNTLTGTPVSGGNNRLLSATEGDGGAGSKQSIPIGPDNALMPGESINMDFAIGLTTRNPFTFFVDVEGVLSR